jgi:hypothetical protein
MISTDDFPDPRHQDVHRGDRTSIIDMSGA